MATLNINGQRVKVGDDFLRMTPEQQNAAVEEIAASLGGQQPGNVAPSPVMDEALAAGSQASQRFGNYDPQAAQAPGRPDLMGATAATLGGIVNSVPILGPLSQNVSDAMVGAGAALTGGDYGQAVEATRARRAELAAANPIANVAGNVGGGLASFGLAGSTKLGAEAIGASGPLAQRAVNSGLSMLGLGTADNMVRGQAPVEAMTNATGPAAISAAIPVIGAGLKAGFQGAANAATRGAQRQLTNEAIKGAPVAVDLKAAARSLFNEVDNSGVAIKSDYFATRVQDLANRASKDLIDSELDAPAVRLFHILADRTRQAYEAGKGLTLGEIHNMRQIAQQIAVDGKGNRTSRFANQVISELDDIVGNLKPTQMQMPANQLGNGASTNAGNALLKGISTWGRARRVDLIEEAIFKASNQASGLENGLRTQFRALLQNKSTRALFSAAELEAIEKVANGTGLSNLSRLLGTFGFDLGSGRNAVGGALGLLAGGPVGAIIGTGARKVSELLSKGAANRAAQVAATPNIPTAAQRQVPEMLNNGVDVLELLGRSGAMQAR
jgi:hypothetical protein